MRFHLGIALLFGLLPAAAPAVAAQKIAAPPGAVRIIRDRWGVPHIYGADAAAVAFGYGYAQAEDHLEAMLRLYAKARGDLSRVDGDAALQNDLVQRALLISETVDATLARTSPAVRRYVSRFADGINYYVDQHPAARLPWYGKVTGHDVFVYMKYAALRNGMQVAAQKVRRSRGLSTREVDGDPPASNAWAIAGSRSATGKAMLLADPHLAWRGDMQWSEAHLQCPEFDVAGASLFGMPQIVMGHNGQVAWANTNNGADIADVYLEKTDPKDPDRYLDNDGSWKRMEKRTFEFAVTSPGGAVRPVKREVRYTRRGPYLTAPGGASYSFTLAGWREGVENFAGSLALMRARSVDEAIAAIRLSRPDKWHFVVADRAGNIYTLGAGLYPRRSPQRDWSRPVPGWEKETEWGPLLAFEELPQMTNPASGLIVQCNNSVFSSARRAPIRPEEYPYYRAGRAPDFRPDTRAARAFALLDAKPKITWDDHLRAALDVRALTAQPLVDALLDGLRARPGGVNGDLKQVQEILRSWDYMATLENRAVPILSHVYRIAGDRDIDVDAAPSRAIEVLDAAVAAMKSLYGSVSVPMSRVQVIERGGREFPVPGVGNAAKLNPFTSLFMSGADRYRDGKWYVNTGSSWLMVISFEDPAKVFTLLPLGQSEDPESPHHTDQPELFSRRQPKPLAFSDADVLRYLERDYVLRLQ